MGLDASEHGVPQPGKPASSLPSSALSATEAALNSVPPSLLAPQAPSTAANNRSLEDGILPGVKGGGTGGGGGGGGAGGGAMIGARAPASVSASSANQWQSPEQGGRGGTGASLAFEKAGTPEPVTMKALPNYSTLPIYSQYTAAGLWQHGGREGGVIDGANPVGTGDIAGAIYYNAAVGVQEGLA